MDKNLRFVMNKRVEKTIKSLEKNNMRGYFVQSEQDAIDKIKEIMDTGDVVSVGGSMTLFEIGAIEFLRNGDYVFLDRHAKGLSKAGKEMKEIFTKSFSADTYITSTNAITEQGELYNIDGTGNRVAAMIYGPKRVIVVIGLNKLVGSLEDAKNRCKEIANPANNIRLEMENPCLKSGFCSDCTSPNRICNVYTVIRRQMIADRMHIIIVNKELGY